MLKYVTVLLLFFLIISSVSALETYGSGDDKIEDMKDRILEEENEEESEEEEEKNNKDEDEGMNPFFEFLFMITADSFNYRFARYPYAANSDAIRFCTYKDEDPDITKWGFVHATSQFSYLFNGICGTTNKVDINIFAVHLNSFYQRIFSENEAFSVISINPGFSIIGNDFLVHYFFGALFLDFLDEAFFSFGFHSQLILPKKVILDIYNLNSIVYSFAFIHGDLSINYALRFINIGAGLTFNYYAETLYMGPLIKLSLWL